MSLTRGTKKNERKEQGIPPCICDLHVHMCKWVIVAITQLTEQMTAKPITVPDTAEHSKHTDRHKAGKREIGL
jgi:hypothetical protein